MTRKQYLRWKRAGDLVIELLIYVVLFLLFAARLFGATESMVLESKTHGIQRPSVSTVAPADFDFTGRTVIGLNITASQTGNRLVSGGGVAWTGTGLNFIVSAATYIINGVTYNSPQTPITLNPADPTNDRIDVFAVDNISHAIKITGAPAGPPLEPQVDPPTQLKLTSVYIAAGATVPPITNENIYLENTEWASSTNSAGTINLASTVNPYAGTKDIEVTNGAGSQFFTLQRPSGTVALSNFTSLILQIRSKGSWANAKGLSIFWMNGVGPALLNIGNPATLKQGPTFDSSNTTSYQQIVIPVSVFNAGAAPVNTLRVAITGGGSPIGFYIDNVILQAGNGGGGLPGGDFSTNTNASVANEIVLFADTTGKLGKRSTGTGITDITNGALGTITIGSGLTFAGHTLSTAGGAGTVTSITATAPIVVTPTPLTATGVISITGSALTKADDANVTLTLGGTPATALLQATSITAGWAGTLSQARGGFGKSTVGTTDGQIPIGKTSDGSWNVNTITAGTGISVANGAGTISIAATGGAAPHAVTFVVDGSGSALSTGTKAYTKIPYGGTLTGWNLIASPSGSVTVDILRAANGAGLPVTSIVGGGTKPAVASAVENSATTFTSWTSTTLTAKDNLAISLSGVTTATYCALTLYYQ